MEPQTSQQAVLAATNIKIHYKRKQELPTLKGILTTALDVTIENVGSIQERGGAASLLDIVKFVQLPQLECYALAGTVASGKNFVLAHMQIPSFFTVANPALTPVTGLFLIDLGLGLENIVGNDDKGRGREGCPTRVLMGVRNCFAFNGMNFYPVMMRDFSIVYYVCDSASKEYDWVEKHASDFQKRFAVAVQHTITYDATLGIYVTRNADLLVS